jgi:hypothetical protein
MHAQAGCDKIRTCRTYGFLMYLRLNEEDARMLQPLGVTEIREVEGVITTWEGKGTIR